MSIEHTPAHPAITQEQLQEEIRYLHYSRQQKMKDLAKTVAMILEREERLNELVKE